MQQNQRSDTKTQIGFAQKPKINLAAMAAVDLDHSVYGPLPVINVTVEVVPRLLRVTTQILGHIHDPTHVAGVL
jgi:hypothetical protein